MSRLGSGRVFAWVNPCPAVTDVAKVCRAAAAATAHGAVEPSQPRT